MIGVEFTKITFTYYFFASDRLWMFRVCVVLFLLVFLQTFFWTILFLRGKLFFRKFLGGEHCVLVIRVELKGSYLKKPFLTSGHFSTLISHTFQQPTRLSYFRGFLLSGIYCTWFNWEHRYHNRSILHSAEVWLSVYRTFVPGSLALTSKGCSRTIL